jgi:hypothetical protein
VLGSVLQTAPYQRRAFPSMILLKLVETEKAELREAT